MSTHRGTSFSTTPPASSTHSEHHGNSKQTSTIKSKKHHWIFTMGCCMLSPLFTTLTAVTQSKGRYVAFHCTFMWVILFMLSIARFKGPSNVVDVIWKECLVRSVYCIVCGTFMTRATSILANHNHMRHLLPLDLAAARCVDFHQSIAIQWRIHIAENSFECKTGVERLVHCCAFLTTLFRFYAQSFSFSITFPIQRHDKRWRNIQSVSWAWLNAIFKGDDSSATNEIFCCPWSCSFVW